MAATCGAQGFLQRVPITPPRPDRDPQLAYDSVRKRTVLFQWLGGDRKTWEWDGARWFDKTPGVLPATSHRSVMAYDPAVGCVLLDNHQTWIWNGKLWIEALNAGYGQEFAAATYVPSLGVVVFGGTTNPSNRLMRFDGNTWTQVLTTNTPPGRNYHALSYDSATNTVVLYGGRIGIAAVGDTWELDVASLTWTNQTGAFGPGARLDHAMVYDAPRRVTVMFGGATSFGGEPLDDVWHYSCSTKTWTEVTPLNPGLPGAQPRRPTPRRAHGMVYDVANDEVVCFGGEGTSVSELNDTWVRESIGLEGHRPFALFIPSSGSGLCRDYPPLDVTTDSRPLLGSTVTMHLESSQIGMTMILGLATDAVPGPPACYELQYQAFFGFAVAPSGDVNWTIPTGVPLTRVYLQGLGLLPYDLVRGTAVEGTIGN